MPDKSRDEILRECGKKTDIVDEALKIALSMLPLHAEEGGRHEVLLESTLVKAMSTKGVPDETGAALVCMLRRQFEALALLDPIDLLNGKWAFISFPAALLGRSWLTTLATPGQSLFPNGYWSPDASEGDKEEQRALLHRIETDRVQLNRQAQPIRVVHVAWAWIRIGDKFLMHRREDKARPGEKSYGLPGGRFNLSDLPLAIQSQPDILQEVFKLDSEIVAEYINITLEREIKEETGLTPVKHYTYEVFGVPLPSFQAVNGAGNRHAYSSYKFHLYQVKLTHAGETRLLSVISRNSNALKWFSAVELAAPQRSDGDSAYIDVLHQALGSGLTAYLLTIPDSGASLPAFVGESMMLDLPGAPGAIFQMGKPGKEKAVCTTEMLDESEWQLLMLLGWHACGYRAQLIPDVDIQLLGNRWIDASSVIPLARSLHEKIESALPGLVEIRENRYLSLCISPDILFFSTELFGYRIRGSKKAGGKIQLKRCDLVTPWGCLLGDSYDRDINGNAVEILRDLEKGDDPHGDWERTLREQLGAGIRAIGLRRLWSTKGNVPNLVEGLRRMSEPSAKV